MERIIFSPCLLYENENFFDWANLEKTLPFINKYLDCALDTYEESFFHISSWYSKPKCDITMMNYFSQKILPILCDLSNKGTTYTFKNIVKLEETYVDPNFSITNKCEFQLLLTYLYNSNKKCLLFVGKSNYEFKLSFLNVKFNISEKTCNVPIVKDPWFDMTGNFDNCIVQHKNNSILPNSFLCTQLDSKMKDEAKTICGIKGSLYKKYGKVIALRNYFKEYKPKHPFEKDTDYYISIDNKYIISVDLLHGHFEVFNATGKQLWIKQINFSGVEIPLEGKTLSEMQATHKVEA